MGITRTRRVLDSRRNPFDVLLHPAITDSLDYAAMILSSKFFEKSEACRIQRKYEEAWSVKRRDAASSRQVGADGIDPVWARRSSRVYDYVLLLRCLERSVSK